MLQSPAMITVRQSLDEDTEAQLKHAKAGDFCFYRFVGGNASETERLEETLAAIRETPVCLFGVFRFPFRFEGKRRLTTAIGQYYRMRDLCHGLTYLSGDGMYDVLDKDLPLQEAEQAFEWLDGAPIRAVEGVLGVNGAMNIDGRDIATFIHQAEGPIYIHSFAGDLDEPLKYALGEPYLPHGYTEGTMMLLNIGYARNADMHTFQQLNLRLTDALHNADLFKLGTHFLDDIPHRFQVVVMISGLKDPYPRPADMPKFYTSRLWFKRKLRSKGRTELPAPAVNGSGTAANS